MQIKQRERLNIKKPLAQHRSGTCEISVKVTAQRHAIFAITMVGGQRLVTSIGVLHHPDWRNARISSMRTDYCIHAVGARNP